MIALLVAALPGCDPGDGSACGRARARGDTTPGMLYLVMGDSPTEASLYRTDLCASRLTPVLPQAVSGVGANGNDVVVSGDPAAGPPKGAGGQAEKAGPAAVPLDRGRERLRRLIDGALVPLPGLEDRLAQDPAVGQDGRIAFVANAFGPVGPPTDRLFVYDPRTAKVEPRMASDRELLRPAWGPDGELAVYQSVLASAQLPEVVIVMPDGAKTAIPVGRGLHLTPAAFPTQLVWGPEGRIALSFFAFGDRGRSLGTATVVVDPATQAQRTVPDITVVAGSPDGRRLLATDDRQRLTLYEAATLDGGRRLGTLRGPTLHDAEWVD